MDSFEPGVSSGGGIGREGVGGVEQLGKAWKGRGVAVVQVELGRKEMYLR